MPPQPQQQEIELVKKKKKNTFNGLVFDSLRLSIPVPAIVFLSFCPLSILNEILDTKKIKH